MDTLVRCALKERMHNPDLVIFYSGCSGKTTFSMRILKLTLNRASSFL